MKIVLGVLMLGVVAMPALATTPYYEDFSTGAPGWVGGQSQGWYSHSDDPYYYWSSGWQGLYVKQPNKNIDGDDHCFYHQVDYTGGSFALSFDLYVLDQQYDAGLPFGLSTNPRDAWTSEWFSPGTDRSWWRAVYGQADPGTNVFTEGQVPGDTLSSQIWYNAEGHWWHHQLTYDDATKQARTLISLGIGGSPNFLIDYTKTLATGFTSDMDYLVISDNRQHHYPSTPAQTYGIGYLDNIAFVPEPATLVMLAVGALAVVGRRRSCR